MMKEIAFSVVVPFIDGGIEPAARLLPSIQRNTLAPKEVIFAGAATDGTVEWLRAQPGVRVVENQAGPAPYGDNVNLGVEMCDTPWVFVMNNDIELGKDFFERMLTSAGKVKRVGMIGPMSNRVMGAQALQASDSEDVDDVNKSLANAPVMFAPIISGLCFLIERDTFLDVGGFDPKLKNGNEDVDLSMRVLESGRSNWIARNVYVWHEGSHTLKKEHVGGVHNRHLLAAKHFSPTTKHRIGCYLRVKTSEKELLAWLRWHLHLFDAIFIVDDGSEVDWDKVLALFPKIKLDRSLVGAAEGEQRTRGVEMARAAGVTALCNLDHDEFLEPKVTRKGLERLLNLPLPSVYGFAARYFHLWNTPSTYNINYPPQQHTFMIKFPPGIPYSYDETKQFHAPRLPPLPISATAPTNIRILHYGYMDAQDRERKRRFYDAHDKVKDPTDIGGKDYSHMTDQRRILLGEWTGDSKDYTISGNMMAEEEPAYSFQIALEDLAPITDELVVRIPPSREDLLSIANRFQAKVILSEWREDFSFHRNEMLQASEGAYIFYKDPDEALVAPGEICELVNYRPDGALFTIRSQGDIVTEAIRLFRRAGARFSGIVHESVEGSIGPDVIRPANHIIHLSHPFEGKRERYRRMNQKMMNAAPSDPRPYLDEGIRTKVDGDFAKASELIRKAIKLEPGFVAAKIELTRLLITWAWLVTKDVERDINEKHPWAAGIRKVGQLLKAIVPEEERRQFWR